MNHSKRYLVFLIVFMIVALVTVGCQSYEKPAPPNNEESLPPDMTNDYNDNDMNNNYDVNNNDNNNDNGNNAIGDKADRIADKVTDMKGINSATVVITGNTALVGVDLDNNAEGNVTTDMKRKIENTVRQTDNTINNVTVTADADLFTRIRNMSRDIRNGRPVSGFAEEINEILRRVTPSM